MILHDVHTHFFNIEDVPMQTFMRRFGLVVSIIIRNFKTIDKDDKIRGFSDNMERPRPDVIRSYVEGMIDMVSKSKKIPEIEKYVICPLTIDFSYESKIKEFLYQMSKMEEALNVTQWTQFEFRPFLGIGHENMNNTALVRKYVNIHKGPYYGIKLYPPLGFDVAKAVNSTVLQYAEDNRIPVTTHCNDGGFPSMRITRETAKRFTHPENWLKVLDKMPSLKLNLAHFGGLRNSWVRIINEACSIYPNVYTDISYVIGDHKRLKRDFKDFNKDNLVRKILFGTDWFMASMESMSIDSLCNPFLNNLRDGDIKSILETNPMKFLY